MLEQFARDTGTVTGRRVNSATCTGSVDFVHHLRVTYPALLDDPARLRSYGVRDPADGVHRLAGSSRPRVRGNEPRELARRRPLLADRNVRPVLAQTPGVAKRMVR